MLYSTKSVTGPVSSEKKGLKFSEIGRWKSLAMSNRKFSFLPLVNRTHILDVPQQSKRRSRVVAE